MSETHGLDNVIHFHRQECNDPECDADAEALRELSALRTERDEARKQLETIKEIADEELRSGSAGMWYQVEAEARHGLTGCDEPAMLTPRNCETCQRAAEAMREAAAKVA